MSKLVQFTMTIQVHDEEELRHMAQDLAGAPSGYQADDSWLDPDLHSLAECVQMVFDPGSGPEG